MVSAYKSSEHDWDNPFIYREKLILFDLITKYQRTSFSMNGKLFFLTKRH